MRTEVVKCPMDKKTPDSKPDSRKAEANQADASDKIADVNDLTYQGGYTGNPREIVTDPAVAPRMQNDSDDDRGHFAEPAEQNES